MQNADDQFVTNVVSRGMIAEVLNDQLARDELQPGDDRLTDEICQEFAHAIGLIGDEDSEGEAQIAHATLQRLGLL